MADGSSWVEQNESCTGEASVIPYDLGQTLSVGQIEAIDTALIAFPVPAKNEIRVNSIGGHSGTFDYKILDVSGRICQEGKSGFDAAIYLDNLAAGNYKMKVLFHDATTVLDVIKD